MHSRRLLAEHLQAYMFCPTTEAPWTALLVCAGQRIAEGAAR
jgi:hypothetical protein